MLQRRGMKKGDLMEKARLSWPLMSKLAKGQPINSEIISRICAALDCQPGDIMEYIPDIVVKVPPDILNLDTDAMKAALEAAQDDE